MKQVKRMMDKAWKLMFFVSEFFRDMLTFIRHNGYSPLESRNKKLLDRKSTRLNSSHWE